MLNLLAFIVSFFASGGTMRQVFIACMIGIAAGIIMPLFDNGTERLREREYEMLQQCTNAIVTCHCRFSPTKSRMVKVDAVEIAEKHRSHYWSKKDYWILKIREGCEVHTINFNDIDSILINDKRPEYFMEELEKRKEKD